MNLNIENLSITSLDFEKNLVFSQTSEICDTFLPQKACFSSRFHTSVSFFLGGLTVVHRSSNILDNKHETAKRLFVTMQKLTKPQQLI